MVDRAKIIEGLEMSYKYSNVDEAYTLVPQWLVLDAITLLKEQEPVEPIRQIEQTEWAIHDHCLCGHCRKHLIFKWMFCPYCGRAVKWDG